MYRISNGRAPALTALGITFAALLVGVTAVRAWQAGPDSLAREVFQTNCSGCHGDDEELMTVLHTTAAAAASIIDRRTKRPFSDLADLEAAVPALDRQLLQAKKSMIFFR